MKACKCFKRFLSVLLSVAMVVGMITVTGPQKVEAAGENLITNGGFDTASNWVDQNGTAVPAQNKVDKVTTTEYLVNGDFEDSATNSWLKGTITPGAGYNGTAGLVYTPSSEGAETYYVVNGLDTTGEITYNVKMRIKTVNAAGNIVSYFSTDKNGGWNNVQNLSANTDWTEYTTTFTTTSGKYRIGIESSAKGTFYIDDVSVTTESVEKDITTIDVVTNGDFEDATINKWLKGTITAGAGYNGTAGLVYTPASEGAETFYELSGLDTTGTVTYTMKIRVKTDGAAGQLVSRYSTDSNGGWNMVANISATTAWTEYTTTFTTTQGKYRIGMETGAKSGTIYIDDLRITYEKQAVDKTDVVVNGDFEDTTINKWLKGTITAGAGYNGTAGLVYNPASEGAETYYELSGLDTTGTVTYTMKIRVKTDGAAGQLVSRYSTDSNGGWNMVANISATTAWTEYTTTFTTTQGKYRIGMETGAKSGTIYIDDLRVTHETPAMKKTYTQGIGTCLDAEADNVLSMKSYTEVKQEINMTSGVNYEYSFQVKSVNAGSDLTFGVQAGGTKQAVNVTSDWTEVTGTINLDADATAFGFYRSGTGEVLIDDVVLTAAAVPTDHTPNLADDYIPDGVANMLGGGDFTEKNQTKMGIPAYEIVDGMAKFEYSGNNTYIQLSDFAAEQNHTYVVSYYIWVQESNGLKLNMQQNAASTATPTGTASWTNLWQAEANQVNYKATIDGQPLTSNLTEATMGWKEIKLTWTAQSSGNVGLYLNLNLNNSGTGVVYVDDLALYDTTPKEKGEAATIELAWMHYSEEYMTAFTGTFPDNTGSAVSTSITILVNGVEKTVNFSHGGNTLSSWMGANILSTTELNEVTIPAETTWNNSNGDSWFYIENDYTFYTQKVEGHWLTWVSEYDYPYGADVQYEDMGSGKEYMFTNTTDLTNDGMRGTFVVVGESDLTLGGGTSVKTGSDYATTKTLGDYHVKRTVGTELYDYTVALYKRGNAHDELNGGETVDVLDARDLVAVKKAMKTGAATFGYARKKAADANVDGRVNSADASFLRNTLVNDWDIMNTTKGETVFDQGTMPIIGYGGPGVDVASDGVTTNTDRMTDEAYSLISEMGFNALTIHSVYADNPTLYKNWAYPALTYADKYGMKLYINDPFISNQKDEKTVTTELLAQRTGQYTEFDSFAGFYVVDEPTFDSTVATAPNSRPFSTFKSAMESFVDYGNLHSWVNLFPSKSQTLGYDMEGMFAWSDGVSEDNYKKYTDRVNAYGAEAISYDMYLRTNGYDSGKWELDYENFYTNLDWARTNSRSYGKPFWSFVQVGTDFYAKNDAKTEQSNLTTKQEMFLEANAALAMGAKGLNYFNIMQSESFATNKNGTVDLYRNGVINVNGEPNYGEGGTKGDGGKYNYVDAVTKINHYVAEIDEVLMNAKNHGVITTDSTVEGYINGAKITSYGAVQSVSGADAFVGCFDYYGKDTYLVVNKSVSTPRTITLDFGGVTKDYATTDMTLATTTGSGTSLALTIPAGESVLVMLDYVEEEIEAGSDFDTAFRFVVASDIHMETANDTQAKRLTDMFDSAYAYAETQDYDSVDAVVLVGDIVNKGIASEYDELAKVLATADIKSETEVLALMGNHEWWTEKTTGADLYLDGIADIDVIQEKGLNWSKNIGGYQFIGMSPLVDDTYGDNIDWMASEVDDAATSNRPVFTFQHHAVSDTIYGSENGGASPKNNETVALDEAYANHNQVINFSGHSHAPINTPTAINQTTYTQFTTGTLKYLTCDGSATVGTHPANNTNAAQFTIVEVSRDNKVRMLPYDEYADQFFAPLGNERADRIEYTVDVNDSSNWLYTSARKDNDEAPYFANNANITISDVTFKAAQVTFDQAKDDTGVYAYDIECISPDRTVRSSYRIYSEWYFSPMPSTLSYPVANLAENTTYTVSITPIDFFGNEGEEITKQFTTAEKTADDMLTLTLNSVDADNTWWFNVNNMDLVASQYYKLPVTIDETKGHVIICKNSDTGRMAIWSDFFPLCGDAAIPTSSFKVTAGTVMQEVRIGDWKNPIAGGDSVEIGKDLTIELVGGVWT